MVDNWTIGSDFEWVLVDNKKVPKSAINIIKGTKDVPFDIGKGCTSQHDNVLVEGGIPPVQNYEDFIKYIDYTIEKCNEQTHPLMPSFNSSHVFAKSQLRNKKAREFGCDPSYCVHTQSIIDIERDASSGLRSSALHIHFGHISIAETDNRNVDRIERIIKWCDIFLGLPSVLLDPDKERRSLYGQAGEFRFQPWGCEYRVLGSYFLQNAKLLEFVWEGTIKALENRDVNIESDPRVIEAINNCDVSLAYSLCEEYNIEIKKILEYA